MKKFFAALLFALALPAWAASYHFCDCQTGAESGCVAGSNANAGTSSAAPKQNISGFDFDSKPAGDSFLFCRGGRWEGIEIVVENMNATRSNPVTFAAYSPSWGGTGRPWLRNANTNGNGLRFGGFNNTTQDGGYRITSLHFDGGGVGVSGGGGGSFGILPWGELNDVVFDDVVVDNWAVIGFYLSGGLTNHITFKNGAINYNEGMGVLGSGTDLTFVNSDFIGNNFSGSGQNHAIYLGGTDTTERVTLKDLRVTNNSRVGTECRGGNVTAHGKIDQLLIENVTILQTGTFIGGCYGFSLNPGYGGEEWIRRITLRGNTVVNTNQAYSCTACTNAVFENNVYLNTTPEYGLGFAIPGTSLQQFGGTGQDLDTNSTFRNNTAVFLSTPHAASTCFRTTQLNTGNGAANAGTSVQIVNNVCHFASAANSPKCMSLDDNPSRYEAISNNLCSSGGGWTSAYTSTAAFEARYGGSGNITTAPTFACTPTTSNPECVALTSGSAGRNAGSNAYKSLRDRNWGKRDSTPDIGAYEFGSTPITVRAPTGVR